MNKKKYKTEIETYMTNDRVSDMNVKDCSNEKRRIQVYVIYVSFLKMGIKYKLTLSMN